MELDGLFYTNRCKECGRALTKLEIIEKMNTAPSLCPCGGNRFRSANFKWWECLLLPRSWKMWVAMKVGVIPPPPTAHNVQENRSSMAAQVAAIEAEADNA